MSIPFNIPYVVGKEAAAIQKVIDSRHLHGGGPVGKRCEELVESFYPRSRALVTTSCTDALEICASLLDIGPGDEVLAPSFTFVSTVNPFVIRGASVRFLDIDYPSLNVGPATVEAAITPRTKVAIAVNYGGGGGDLRGIREVCDRHGVVLIEDAAQSLLATQGGQPLGTFGLLSAVSFHETKNVHCGEGGALVINDPSLFERAEIIREKGTDRSKFFRGQIDKYSWVDIGSSHIPSELNSAFLSVQLEHAADITAQRVELWMRYAERCDREGIDYMRFAPDIGINGHVFGVFAPDIDARRQVMSELREAGIQTVFHYVPLHSAPMGIAHGSFHGEDVHTTNLSERLIRLPLYPGLRLSQVDLIVDQLARAMPH